MPLLEAVDVTRFYAMNGQVVEAVRGVSLDVESGQFVAIVGPSGSGKSTMLHLLAGVDQPTSGTVRLGDTVITALSDRDRTRHRLHHVGLVFQRFHLLPMLTALENVEIPMAEAGLSKSERRKRARELLERVGLTDRLAHRPGQLSGGQRQRVAVARAIANRPQVLLADEPTGELDRGTSEGIRDLFAELRADGTAIVVATHDLDLARSTDTTIRLVDGRIADAARGSES